MKIHELYPYIAVRDAAAAVDFYKQVFGVEERLRLVEPGGRIGHVELAFGEHILMIADEFPELGFRGPEGPSASMEWPISQRWPNGSRMVPERSP